MSRPALLALALLALTAGCGGGGGASKADFQANVVDARDRLDAGMQQVVEAGDFDELLDRMEIAAVEARKAATEIEDAEAPDGLGKDKDELEKALRSLSEEILGTVETFDSFGPNAPITRGINFEAWDTVQAELADLRDKGIQVPPLARHAAESG